VNNDKLREILLEELEAIKRLLILFLVLEENQRGISKYKELFSAMKDGCEDLSSFIELSKEDK
jgi:hypothetical protein